MTTVQSHPTQYSAPTTQHSTPPFPTLFPKGHLTILLGDPGTGKSLIATDLAARVTRGTSLSLDPSDDPHTLVACFAKEDPPEIFATRLLAAGGDFDNARGHTQNPSLVPPRDDPWGASLVQYIRDERPALLILDPLPTFLGTYDCNQPATIRRLLDPFLHYASDTAIVGILHHNKSRLSPRHSQLHSAAGSHAYTALARSVLLVTPYPYPYPHPNPTQHSELSTQHFLTPIKLNNAPITHTFPFSIQGIPFKTDYAPRGMDIVPILHWHTPIPLQNSLPSQPDPDIESSQLDLACHFLRTTLANGPLPAAHLQKQARSLAISSRTLCRARKYVPVQHTHNGPTNTWYVTLAKSSLTANEGDLSWDI